MIVMTTDGVRPSERVEYWADLISRNVTPMRMEPVGGRPLHGQVRAQTIGDLTVAEITVAGIHALHTRAQVAHTRGHLYAACVQLEGEARIDRHGEQIELQKGDVFITDSRHEYTLDLERPGRRLAISLPTRWLESRVARPELLSGTVLRDHPLGRLWASHLATGFTIASDFSPSAATLFARHSIELLVQSLEEAHCSKPTPSEAARAAMFLHACHLIGLKFGNPNLAPDKIARELGVSTRTLTRIFGAHNETIMRRVFDERVRQAAKLLIAPEAAHRSVTEIAFACGFNDLSHFGRVFAAGMHMTPPQWRHRKQ
jgi:AraC-like DNA-binding protein